jgi:hypothetical protein
MKNPKLERLRQIHGSMTLAVLHNECLRTGSEYAELIKESYALLVQLKEPITENMRNQIFSHRGRELTAHAAYSKARTLLWDFLTDSKVGITEADQKATISRAGSSGVFLSALLFAYAFVPCFLLSLAGLFCLKAEFADLGLQRLNPRSFTSQIVNKSIQLRNIR